MSVSSPTSVDKQFSNEHLSGDLKRLSVRGGMATLAGQGVKFLLQLASTMILARLLTPGDFGLIAMVTAITAFIMVFRELGLSQATIQRAEINHGQVSTLFWINVAVGVALMLITLALAPAVAWFYKDPRLILVTAALSTTFVFSGLTVQHEALLRRQMRLTTVATRDVAAMAAGILTAVLCAWDGMGYWSLVWMHLVTAATNAAFVWFASGWIPGRPVRRSGVRSMLKLGGWLTAFSFVNYFARNLDSVLIGRFCGSQPLGLYSRAYSLLLFPLGQITAPMTAVAVPALSRLQNEPERYRRFYLKAVKLIAYVSMPLVSALGVLSSEVVQLILGTEWLEAGPIFTILALAAVCQPIGSTVGWIFISSGQTRRMFAWNCVAVPLILLSFLAGLPWGARGVASGYAVCNILLIVPELSFALKHSPISLRDVLAVLCRPLTLSLAVTFSMIIARAAVIESGPAWIFLASLATGATVLIALSRALSLFWADMQDIFDLRKVFLNRTGITNDTCP